MKPGSYPDLLASARILVVNGCGYTLIFPHARFIPPHPYEFWDRQGSSQKKRALGAVDLLAMTMVREGGDCTGLPSG
jgi:hypothetical protein